LAHGLTNPLSDSEVIGRVLDGQPEAFGLLVDRYQDEFARYARFMSGSEEDAADIIQESLIRAYRSLHRCREPDNFKGWLFSIVSNRCKTHLARQRRRTEALSQSAGPEGGDLVSRGAERDEVRRKVEEALGGLSPEQREAIVLKYIEDKSLQDISTMTGSSLPALKMRLLRARSLLRERLNGWYE
jgi:RNA polymerase sigma-70 factor (ECF subfamily)